MEQNYSLYVDIKKYLVDHIFNVILPRNNKCNMASLGAIASFSKGKNISKKDLSDNGFPCITYGELYTYYNEIIDSVKSKTSLDKNDLILTSKNDVIIPGYGETAIDLANAACILEDNIAICKNTIIIKTQLDGIFLSFYLNYKRKEIAKYVQGGSIMYININDLKKVNLLIPPLKDQRKINKILSSVNKKIELTNKQINLMKTYKKGLLQKMFC